MEELVRIENIKISGIKNVTHGEINFNEYTNILNKDLTSFKSILGIYGQNGSGKTTVLETTTILKNILLGDKLPENIDKYISNDLNEAKISYTFYIKSEHYDQLVTYTFLIGLIEDSYDIISEKMVSKEFDFSKNKWNSQINLFECANGKITFAKLAKKISTKQTIELNVTKELEKGSSLFFNKRNRLSLITELENKDEDKLIDTLQALYEFANRNLIIIEKNYVGSKNLDTFIPINIYLSDQKGLSKGAFPLNLLIPNELPIAIFSIIEKVVKQIDIVISTIIPTLHIKIINVKEQLTKDGEQGCSFEVVSERNNKYIPLKYESEGIKRILSVTSSMIAAYNDPAVCLMIDEFDSGVFEFLLGELVEIMCESAKGQFIFTSHNLRALEKVSSKSIVFTTTNPMNRYIQLGGIKPTNNVRDYYYKTILLGGQSESVYEETKNYRIKRAFRNAGKLYE
ncbi:MAG: AAA family ATPase [Erysipelotrichaceae bacterium]